MDWRKAFVFAFAVSSILIFGGMSYAQQEGLGAASEIPDVQWLWGETVSLDVAKGEVVVKFLDYETEQEKQVAITTDDKTTYENVNSLAEIKTADTLSIDYVVDKDGKNIAKNISVERPEEINAPDTSTIVEPTMESVPETATEAAQPSQEPTQEPTQEPAEQPVGE
jgi:hypothetical protein